MTDLDVSVLKTCIFCSHEHKVVMDKEKYFRWRNGELIQNVFPEMTSDQREILISGTCPECWDKYMKDDEDEG